MSQIHDGIGIGRRERIPAAKDEAAAPAEDLTDDTELVAVISAAIAASEGTTTEGFVVRSINRR